MSSSLRRLRTILQALSLAFVATTLAATPQAFAADSTPRVDVIVQEAPGAGDGPETAVRSLGGVVGYDLPIIDGFSASLPATRVAALEATQGVRYVTPDRTVHVQSDAADTAAAADTPSVYKSEVGADKVNSGGVTGKGVTVALIDTGVSDVADLRDRIVPVRNDLGGTKRCVNFSGESGCGDSYGHGTFIAGLIAGTGAASNGKYTGVAPGADILSIKIAGANGAAPVGKVLYALQWVVENRAAYDIEVLNLSLGTDATNTYRHDPLNQAVEKAWFSGVTVVVSAGNRGSEPGTISKPADDPFVLTVGAVDDRGTKTISDDQLPNFSSRGPTAADGITKPDLVAPGARLVSVRSPGSSIEKQFPTGVDSTYRRGSGTSMATGVVSGSVALLLQAHPELTPDRIKHILTSSGRDVASENRNEVGSGIVDIAAAVRNPADGEANNGVTPSDGSAPLSLSQGTVQFTTDGLVGGAVTGLTGLLRSPDPSDPSGGSWYGGSWYGGSWYGGSWYGGSWYGQPNGGSWYGGSWYGGSWYGAWQ